MNKDLMISVIVPLYYGKKYISQIISQIEWNKKLLPNEIRIELVFVNDAPDDYIEVSLSNSVDIKVINLNVNRGIHGARVEGLKNTSGNYVLFLDQDDLIKPEFFKSQLSVIGDADVAVCRCITNRRLHYTETHVFERVVTKEFMMNNWCPIVSPGQVLIRRDAIPQLWTENILVVNGADDYFLWLCLVGANKKIALNQEVLYEHVFTGKNVSEDTNKMMDSENEMLQILKNSSLFNEKEVMCLENLKDSLRRIHIKQLETQRRALRVLTEWYLSYLNKSEIYKWIESNRKSKIAIYGAGELGIGLKNFLVTQNLNLVCYIDQNAPYIISDLPAFTVDAMMESPDIILLTIPSKSIEKELVNKFECQVLNVENI